MIPGHDLHPCDGKLIENQGMNVNDIDTAILTPVFKTYAAVSHARVKYHMSAAVSLDFPVCSVGNIAFGGTAKTPTVEYIARSLVADGHKPGIALRGWKGRLDRENLPPELVSDGRDILLGWHDCGDEARLLARELLGLKIPVAIGRNRIDACKLLIENTDVDLLILDDGFQYVKLKRNVDLVLLDTLIPFGRMDLKTGPLREPASALSRADAILLTRIESVPDNRLEKITRKLNSILKNPPPIFNVRTVVKKIISAQSGEILDKDFIRGKRIMPFMGIGNPLSFEHTVGSLEVESLDSIVFPDHYPYDLKDIDKINRRALLLGAEIIATTSKDAVRLNGFNGNFELPLCVVEIEMAIDEEEEFIGMLKSKMLGERTG
ncbi:MAG TPA: tetraacyldisaccharide 4'-kinase [Firmicutes bacterium]|nr:tetraacyldisaccharide 4'-kinase [Bacillota bacterium]